MGKAFTIERRKEIDDFVLANYQKYTTRELALKLNISARSINRSKLRLNIETPRELLYVYTTTRFRKGYSSVNSKDLYHETISVKNQEVYIKFKQGKDKNFMLKKTFIWENNYGKVPKGFVLRHKDGNKLNNEIENLYLISKKEILKENSFNNLPNEIRETCNLIAKIKREISHE